MVKKILKYGIGIIVIVILLILALIFKPSPQNEKDSNTEENKTIEEQVQETLSLDPNDENIIGYITIKDLGIGSTSTDIQETPIKLPIENVKEIKTGTEFMLAIKEDGTVWGTGSNTTGALGRWQYADGKYSESYYKTAFDWVRCPDLEK